MKKVINSILLIALVVLAIRVTNLETQIKEVEKDLINRTNNYEHRMQDFENYVEYLEREYEPYITEVKMKQLNERL